MPEVDADGVVFTLPAACHWPMFETTGWGGGKPHKR